ncbi:MAG TPA: ribbon-helix-helix protein, CopG family [Gemmatimonadales bacterium]|nr:ribbon-helix-helix protein, CopG family [Gemmatimonadales bacterium]
MVTHMKTTLNIPDAVMAELRREAARQGRTMSELVEAALRTSRPGSAAIHLPRS